MPRTPTWVSADVSPSLYNVFTSVALGLSSVRPIGQMQPNTPQAKTSFLKYFVKLLVPLFSHLCGGAANCTSLIGVAGWQLLHGKCLNKCLSQRNAQLIIVIVIFIIPKDFANRLASDGVPVLCLTTADYKFREVYCSRLQL